MWRINKIIIWFIFIFSFTHCISEYNSSGIHKDEGILVVEANIVGNSTNYIYLSRTTSLSSENSFIPESGAIIYLQCKGERISEVATESDAGIYILNIGILNSDLPYSLLISTATETFQSEESYPLSTPDIDDITWEKTAKGEPVNMYVSTHEENSQSSYFQWTFEEDWEFQANTYTYWHIDTIQWEVYSSPKNPGYYCWNKNTSKSIIIESTQKLNENKITNLKIHSIPCDDIRLSFLYSILVKQRKISKEAYDYYKIKKTFNEEMGSLFSPQPSELKGNIHNITNPENPTIGFINISVNTSEKRIFIEGEKVYEYPKIRDNICIPLFFHKMPGSLKSNVIAFYSFGLRPNPTNGSIYDEVVKAECTDCRVTGTKNKPDFWPNDHE